MDQVIKLASKDPTAAHFVETCKWMQHLSIPLLREEREELVESVLSALRLAAKQCSEGQVICKVNERPLDDESQKLFRLATLDLVVKLDSLEQC